MKTYISLVLFVSIIYTGCKSEGCTYEEATNYDSDAEVDDGSCIFPEFTEEISDSAANSWTGNYNLSETESPAGNPEITSEGSYSISITEIDENTVLIQNFLDCSSLEGNVTATSMVPTGLSTCEINTVQVTQTAAGFTYSGQRYDAGFFINFDGEAVRQ